jgi:hypothetical protein
MQVMQVVHYSDVAITRPSSVLLHVITWKIAMTLVKPNFFGKFAFCLDILALPIVEWCTYV